MQQFSWPYSNVPGIRYGNLNADQLARLPPVLQQRLSPAGTALTANDVVNAGVPELTLADPVIPPEPHQGPGNVGAILPMLYGSFNNQALLIGAADQLVLNIPPGDAERIYLFVINTHPLQDMFISFQVASTLTLGVPILHNFGFIEFNIVVPQDDVHLIANGAGTTGVMLFSNRTPAAVIGANASHA